VRGTGSLLEARQFASRALTNALSQENDELEREIGARLKVYKSNKPYTDRS
jgi:hypothetical protein